MMERRFYKNIDVRMAADGEESPKIVGIAAPFGAMSEVMQTRSGAKFRETIAPGAFSEAVNTDDVRCLLNHDPNLVLGRRTSGTLRLMETSEGLQIENDLPDTSYAKDLRVSMERGDINQMSFGFIVKPGGDKWEMADGMALRTLTNVELADVSIVTFPAYAETTADIRSMQEWQREQQEEIGPGTGLDVMQKKLNLKEKEINLK